MSEQGSNEEVRKEVENDRGLSPLFDDWSLSITAVKENEDGSMDVELTCDENAKGFLIQEGLIAVLKRHIEIDKNAQDGMKLRRKE